MREREGRETERGETIVRSMTFNILSTSQDHLRTKWKETERQTEKKDRVAERSKEKARQKEGKTETMRQTFHEGVAEKGSRGSSRKRREKERERGRGVPERTRIRPATCRCMQSCALTVRPHHLSE